MKTKDRILHVSLYLFNTEGEGNVSTVDIANELDMSPGNLYYHFKGKEPIVGRLLESYSQGMETLMNQPEKSLKSLEDHWLYLYVLTEQVYHFRFFYRNATDLLLRMPKLQQRFTRLQQHMEASLAMLMNKLSSAGSMNIGPDEVAGFSQSLCLQLTQWFNYNEILGRNLDEKQSIHSAVYQLISLSLPYVNSGQQDLLKGLKDLYYEA